LHPYCPYNGLDRGYQTEKSLDTADAKVLVSRYKWSFTIFHGTSEIQHLFIARAISGVHIE